MEITTSSPAAQPKVVFVCVNYNTPLIVPRFVRSALTLRGAEQVQVVVVDNPGNSGERLPLGAVDSRVTYVQPRDNLGYIGGAAYGLAAFLRAHSLPEWVIVSNVDLEFASEDFLERLTTFTYGEQVGILAPRVHSLLTRAEQNPYMRRRPTSLRMQAYTWLSSSYAVAMAYEVAAMVWKRVRGPRLNKGCLERIYAPHGSCMIFHRRYFEAGCTLVNPCFLFGEELIAAEAARCAGLQVVYDPQLAVTHLEHVSTGVLMSRHLFEYARGASRYCACEYFSRRKKPSGGYPPIA